VRTGPTALARVLVTQSQQHGFELLASAAQVVHRVGACAAKISHRFIGRVRNVHGGEVAGPVQSRQFDRIAPIVLDPIAALLGQERRGGYQALDA